MRVSTGMIYEVGISGVQERQQDLFRLQQQLSTGQRVLVPADDPVAAAAALDLKQSRAIHDQYRANGDVATAHLLAEEGALGNLTTLLQDVKTIAVYAGNATLAAADRAALAVELQSHYQGLLAIANQNNGNGQYLFAGYQGATRPFAETAPGSVVYSGDQGQRMVQIGASRAVAVSDSGAAVFLSVKDGNGTFAASPAAGNSGSAVIGPATVTDPARWNSAPGAKDFTIRFHVAGSGATAQTTYDIVDNVNNVSLLTGAAPGSGPYLRPYSAGSAITLKSQVPPDTNPAAFDFGASVTVSGAPANNDAVTVRASANRDLFSTLHQLISALQSGKAGDAASTAAYQNTLNASMAGLDNALDKVLTVRAEVGARLRAVSAEQDANEGIALDQGRRLSELLDLDYAKAISDLSLRQTELEAAQKSFISVTSLSLFSLL